jgi:hypothetical protein
MRCIKIAGLCGIVLLVGWMTVAAAYAGPEFYLVICQFKTNGNFLENQDGLCRRLSPGLGSWEEVFPAVAAGEKVEVEDISRVSKLESPIAKLPVYIECDEDLAGPTSNVLEEKGKSTGKDEFKNCNVFENSKGKRVALTGCTVKEPIVMEFTGALIEHGIDELKGKAAEETFAELKIEGEKCTLKGTYKLKGAELCSISEAEYRKMSHEFLCTPAGGKLKLGAETAQLFSTEMVKLKTSLEWGTT